MVEKSLGGESPCTAPVLDNLSLAYAGPGPFRQGPKMLPTAPSPWSVACGDRNIPISSPPKEHPSSPRWIFSRATMRRPKNFKLSNKIAAGLEAAAKARGSKPPPIGRTTIYLRQAEVARGHSSDARPHLNKAKECLDAAYNKEHPLLASVLGDLASLDTSPRTLGRGIAEYKQAWRCASTCGATTTANGRGCSAAWRP